MRKTAATLSLLLSACLLIAFVAMNYTDGKTGAARIETFYAQREAGMLAANLQDQAEWQQRETEEREYGFGAAIALIAGLALWPRTANAAQVSAIEQPSNS